MELNNIIGIALLLLPVLFVGGAFLLARMSLTKKEYAGAMSKAKAEMDTKNYPPEKIRLFPWIP